MEQFEEYMRRNKAALNQEAPGERVRQSVLGYIGKRRRMIRVRYYSAIAASIVLVIAGSMLWRRPGGHDIQHIAPPHLAAVPTTGMDTQTNIHALGQMLPPGHPTQPGRPTPPGQTGELFPPSSVRRSHFRDQMAKPVDIEIVHFQKLVYRQKGLIHQTGVRFLSAEDYDQFFSQYRECLRQVDDDEKAVCGGPVAGPAGHEASVQLIRLYGKKLSLLQDMYARMMAINNHMRMTGDENTGKLYHVNL